MTVAQFKALVAAIPATLDDLTIAVPDGFVLPIVADQYTAKRGGVFHTVVASVDLVAGRVDELPYEKQDYAQLFLTDGTPDPKAFKVDGRVKPGATKATAIALDPVEIDPAVKGKGG